MIKEKMAIESLMQLPRFLNDKADLLDQNHGDQVKDISNDYRMIAKKLELVQLPAVKSALDKSEQIKLINKYWIKHVNQSGCGEVLMIGSLKFAGVLEDDDNYIFINPIHYFINKNNLKIEKEPTLEKAKEKLEKYADDFILMLMIGN